MKMQTLFKLGIAYEAEALALFARFTVPPTDERKRLINRTIKKLKQAGVWQQLDAFYLIAAADAQSAQRNWKADTFNLSPVGTITFIADRGYAGNGVDGHLTTGFTPSTAGGKFAQDAAHLSIWSRNNIQSSSQIPIGSRTAAAQHQCLILPRLGTDVAAYRLTQDGAGASPASLDSIGHWCVLRSGPTTLTLFRNGLTFSIDATASTGLSTAAIVLDAINTGGVISSFATHQLAAASMGGSLTNGQIYELYAAVSQYLQAIGA